MRRCANIALALAVLAITVVVADPQVTIAASAPRADLIDPLCQTALDPAGRVVSVTAVMRPLPGTQKLAIEFLLFERASGSATWTLVSDPVQDAHLGVWITPPDPTLGQRPGDVWNVPFEVANLAGPATYRFGVQFRWTGLRGRLLGLLTRVSGACKQPELRPDLTVNSVEVNQDPAHPRLDQFAALIGNGGLTGSGPFTVQLTYTHDQAGVTDTLTVAHIGPHGSRMLQLAGQLCDAGTNVTVTADPDDQVDVYSRSQASITVTCPAPTISVSASPSAPVTSSPVAPVTSSPRTGPLGAVAMLVLMKQGIHPEYVEAHVSCSCGNQFVTRSTKPQIHVEICSACHPFYTGRQKLVDTGGRVERFQRRVAKGRRAARATA